MRDRGCIWPGCTKSASFCTGDHLKHWLYGGMTNTENTGLLCAYHHYLVHEGGWQIMVADDRRIVTVPPTPTYEWWRYPRGPDTALAV